MAEKATHHLKAHIRGDSWRGLSIRIRVNGNAPTVPVSSAKMQFRRRPLSQAGVDDSPAELTLHTSDDSIEITDASAWIFLIPPVLNFPLESGVWHYDFETVNNGGFKRTYLGGTMTITRDITQ